MIRPTEPIVAVALPAVVGEREIFSSPWVSLVEKNVDWGPPLGCENYYSLRQADYVVIFARTQSGLIPMVRQYRPAVEGFTLELPSGMIEANESPEACARRELKEETGLDTLSSRYLGAYIPDTGRLPNTLHVVEIVTVDPPQVLKHELGIQVSFMTLAELKNKIREGAFRHMLHIGVLTVFDLMAESIGGT